MSVVPVQVPVNTSVPALTLAAGSAGGVAIASTIDPVNDYSLIYTASAIATQGINRNTYLGISSQPVGISDSQTLTNKTITSPTISSPTLSGTVAGTYTLGGTPTFPASVATLTGTQTLTNKTLTSPTINSPTITNATISSDVISGYTSSSNGTIYGISVTGGVITTAGAVGSGAIATGAVAASNLATNAITLGYTPMTTNFTTTTTNAFVDVTSLTSTVTVPSGGRNVKISVFIGSFQTSGAAGTELALYIREGSTVLGSAIINEPIPAYNTAGFCMAYVPAPSAGSHTYKVSVSQNAAGTIIAIAGAANPTVNNVGPAFILVEAI